MMGVSPPIRFQDYQPSQDEGIIPLSLRTVDPFMYENPSLSAWNTVVYPLESPELLYRRFAAVTAARLGLGDVLMQMQSAQF